MPPFNGSTDQEIMKKVKIGRTIEGRHTRENNIGDDTARPDITLRSIVLG
jgi:hypothetical protein